MVYELPWLDKTAIEALKWSTGVIKWFTGLPWLDTTLLALINRPLGSIKWFTCDKMINKT